ncbi:MAG: hypothetical protein E5W72_12640 [Mesorhizobium sp.]|uniref:hypothetical protein n=1 Tax=Mesorhizobium sp. TaxID=1871066 RepID=UPI0011FC770E
MIDSRPTNKNKDSIDRKTMSASIDSNDSFSWLFQKADDNDVDASVDAPVWMQDNRPRAGSTATSEAWLGHVLPILPMSIRATGSKSCCCETRG